METLRCDDVSFSYPDRPVLYHWTKDFPPGTSSAIIGPNGSGKTTLLKLLTGLVIPSSGRVYFGRWNTADDWKKFRSKIGLSLYSERSFNFRLDGYQNAEFIGALNGLHKHEVHERIEELFSRFDAARFFECRFSDLSLGQRSIYGLLVAALTSHGIVILDEPTSTLDAKNRRVVYAMISALTAGGHIMIVSTHDMEVAEACDYVITSEEFLH